MLPAFDRHVDLGAWLAEAGVSRVNAVTAHDWPGLPVYAAVRPNSRSVTVELAAAAKNRSQASDAVKWRALARYAAEHPWRRVRFETSHQLAHDGRQVVDCESLPLALHSRYSPRRPLPWITGQDLLSGDGIEIPFELVHAADLSPPIEGMPCFAEIPRGLAAAPSPAAATLAALHEAVADEAARAATKLTPRKIAARRLAASQLRDPRLFEIAGAIRRQGGSVFLWDVSTRPGTFVLAGSIAHRLDAHLSLRRLPPVVIASGDDFAGAATAALLAAACARVAVITGRAGGAALGGPWKSAVRRSVGRASAVPELRLLRTQSGRDVGPGPRLTAMLNRLRCADSGPVVAIDLTRPGWQATVTRVLLAPRPTGKTVRCGDSA